MHDLQALDVLDQAGSKVRLQEAEGVRGVVDLNLQRKAVRDELSRAVWDKKPDQFNQVCRTNWSCKAMLILNLVHNQRHGRYCHYRQPVDMSLRPHNAKYNEPLFYLISHNICNHKLQTRRYIIGHCLHCQLIEDFSTAEQAKYTLCKEEGCEYCEGGLWCSSKIGGKSLIRLIVVCQS